MVGGEGMRKGRGVEAWRRRGGGGRGRTTCSRESSSCIESALSYAYGAHVFASAYAQLNWRALVASHSSDVRM